MLSGAFIGTFQQTCEPAVPAGPVTVTPFVKIWPLLCVPLGVVDRLLVRRSKRCEQTEGDGSDWKDQTGL